MKRIFILLLFLISSCGFEPLYSNKNLNKFTFEEIKAEGEKKINRRIISAISINKDSVNYTHKKFILKNEKNIIETSKDSKGLPDSYRMTIRLKIILIDKENNSIEKDFYEEFSYKNQDNKFDLSEYEIKLENDLIDKIVEDLIIYLNI